MMEIKVKRGNGLNSGFVNNIWYGNSPSIEMADLFTERVGPTPKRIQVDKRTHRIRFENETESQVTLIIEPKETNET